MHDFTLSDVSEDPVPRLYYHTSPCKQSTLLNTRTHARLCRCDDRHLDPVFYESLIKLSGEAAVKDFFAAIAKARKKG